MKLKYTVWAALLGTLSFVANTYLKISTGGVPWTMGTLAVLVAGLLLPPRWAVASQVIHVLISCIVSQAYISATFGFFLGFIASAYVTSIIYSRGTPNLFRLVLAIACGAVVVYVIGIPYFYAFMHLNAAQPFTLERVIQLTLLPFIITDTIKAIAAGVIGTRLRRVLFRD